MRKTIAVVCGVVLLAGCGKAGFIKPGATQAQYFADMQACLHQVAELTGKGRPDVETSNGPFHQSTSSNAHEFNTDFEINMRNQCMESKGWRIGREGQRYYPFS